jgi:predicted enzyme related to lactoylglutathione lyase
MGKAPHVVASCFHVKIVDIRLISVWLWWTTMLCVGQISAAAPVLPPLTTASGNPRLPGKFIWADLVTDDVPKAQKFYATLFGWQFQSTANYAIAMNNDRPVCGMFQRPRPSDQSVRPRWFGYLSVGSVDKAERTVTKLGGRVLAPAQEFLGRGQQAVFADPEGAVFGAIKSASGDPEDFQADLGDWVWIQLLSRDGQKAAEFYRKLADYTVVENVQPNRLSDFVLTSKGYARATVRTLSKQHEQVKPNWLLFVRVNNVKESVARTRQLGGQVLVEPSMDYLQGKVAVVSDPTGAAVGLLEWSESLVKTRR